MYMYKHIIQCTLLQMGRILHGCDMALCFEVGGMIPDSLSHCQGPKKRHDVEYHTFSFV